jgi:hypothetical protein
LADPGEVCDVARDPDGCTPLCQLAACGDGYWSPIEACDDSDPDPEAPSVEIDVDACTRQCYATAFWDDMGNADTSSTKWASSSDPMNSTGWSVREGAWASGTYPATATVVTLVASGIVLPSLQPDEVTSGAKIELRFTHSVAFDDCRGDPAPDGALIEIRGAFGTRPVIPVQPSGYPDVLAGPETCEATLDDPNPLASREVFASSGVDQAVRVDLTEYAGETVEIAFIVGYDCGNCGTPNDHAWTLDDVVIARFDPPR